VASRKARKMLESMRQSAANWSQRDIANLMEGFGFVVRHGRSHDIFTHPVYKHLRLTLPRHNEIAVVYVKSAIGRIDELIVLSNDIENTEDEDGDSHDTEF
jgi:hypothetical protein